MARSYYSTAFAQTAPQVWAAIRDFGEYRWAGDMYRASIEEGRPGDAVGSVRSFPTGDETVVPQRLLAHSDLDRAYSYQFCDPCPFPLRNYIATLRVLPITDGDRSLVEWSATFDCLDAEYDRWTAYFEESFAGWLGSLRTNLAE